MTTSLIRAVAVGLTIALAAWLFWPNRQSMPDVMFNLTDGRQLSSTDLEGQRVLVNFWSVSCEICLRDMPKLSRLATTLGERGLVVIGVAMPYDPPTAVMNVTARLTPTYPVALDVGGEISRGFGDVQVTPTTFLIGPDGDIAYTEQGALDETRIRATFLTL